MGKPRWNTAIRWCAAAALFIFLCFVACQSIGQIETIVTRGDDAKQVLAVGETVTIGWKFHPIWIRVKEKAGDHVVTLDGRNIPFRDIHIVRKGYLALGIVNPSIAERIYNQVEGSTQLNGPLYISLYPPRELVTTIESKTAEVFVTMDHTKIPYKNVGYVTRVLPFYEAFPRNLLQDIEIWQRPQILLMRE